MGNTVRKVLHHVREEYYNAAQQLGKTTQPYSPSSGQSRSQQALSTVSRSDTADGDQTIAEDFKPVLLDAIQDVLDELETVYENVSKSAKDLIHSE